MKILKSIKKLTAIILSSFGIASSLGITYILLEIHSRGYCVIGEPNSLVLNLELCLNFLTLGYMLFNFLKNILKKEESN